MGEPESRRLKTRNQSCSYCGTSAAAEVIIGANGFVQLNVYPFH